MAIAAGIPGADLIPARSGALPRLHVDAEGRARPVAGSRTSRRSATPTSADRVLRARDAHAPVAPVRGSRRLVPDLRLPGSRGHDLPAESSRSALHADGSARAGRRAIESARTYGLRSLPADRAFGLDSAGVAASGRRHRLRRHRVPEGHGRPAARATSTHSTTRSSGLPTRAGTGSPTSRRRDSTSSSSTRRATTFGGCAWRWTACCRTALRSSSRPEAPDAASTRSSPTTHRQNFLVPPRAHRSFPLSELRD